MNSPGPKPPVQSTLFVLLGDIANTTWRMFVPTITGAVGGLWLDQRLATEPWCAILGLVLGLGSTVLLIRQQYKNIDK